jgi:hypothetical protein
MLGHRLRANFPRVREHVASNGPHRPAGLLPHREVSGAHGAAYTAVRLQRAVLQARVVEEGEGRQIANRAMLQR